MAFSTDESYINTDLGRIWLEHSPNGLPNETNVPVKRWKVDHDWLFHDGQKLLWLPPDFRPINPSGTALREDLSVIGHQSGKLSFFEGITQAPAPDQAYEATASERRSGAGKRVGRNCSISSRATNLMQCIASPLLSKHCKRSGEAASTPCTDLENDSDGE